MSEHRYEYAISGAVSWCNGFSAPACTRAAIGAFLDELWQPMDTAPTGRDLHGGAASTRILLWVPSYGATTGHFDGEWHLHSILNKDAKPTHWMHCPEGPK